MRIIYDAAIFLYSSGIRIASLTGNKKAGLWIAGRKNQQEISSPQLKKSKNRVWFHCASLGEFEQGRPLIEKIKSSDPSVFIILTFFSPSGYEIRKNYTYADLVCYLPIDTAKNAEDFIEAISPGYVVFIKYEFWLHYFEELAKKKIPLFIASATFRPSQIFFKWYGSFFRRMLKHVTHFFVQDELSEKLLRSTGFTNTTIAGDTRFDRVNEISAKSIRLPLIEEFRGNNKLFVAGSTWPKDEVILDSLFPELKKHDFKIVIAPHEVSPARIKSFIDRLASNFSEDEICLYSSEKIQSNSRILIIDNIGMLSSIYSYGNMAWIGGGFGNGIHNILEAATYGLPIMFGPNYKKFREAIELIDAGGAFCVHNSDQALNIFSELVRDESRFKQSGKISSDYVRSRVGASDKIMTLISKMITV